MIIDLMNKSGNYVPSFERNIDHLSFKVSEIIYGKYEIKLTFSSLPGFSEPYDIVPEDGSISIRTNIITEWTPINGNILTITDPNTKYIEIKLSNIQISEMVGQSTDSCFARLKMVRDAVEDKNQLTLKSPFYAISLLESTVIEINFDKTYKFPLRCAYVHVNQYIEGSPDVKLEITNEVPDVPEHLKVPYRWTPIKNGDITDILPLDGDIPAGSRYSLRVRVTVTKTTSRDVYRLFNVSLDAVEDKYYRRRPKR